MTRAELLAFLRGFRYAVQSSVHPTGAPQGATVGFAVSEAFEIVFDTLGSTRKARNLRARPSIALVFGDLSAGAQRSVQLEGIADEPSGADRARLIALYLGVFPDGVARQEWPGLTYFRATPTWLRYSDYRREPPEIVEFDRTQLVQFK
jgi:hypothetical protein